MFNMNDYYEQAHSGKIVDNTEILNYIKGFNKVILWGGSFLGTAVGKYLLENDVTITAYWDMRKD